MRAERHNISRETLEWYGITNRYIPPGVKLVQDGARVFLIDPKRHIRFGPVVAIAAMAAGTGMQMYDQIQEGKAAEKIAEHNAAVLRQNAEFSRRQAAERAKIEAERGRRLLASQKAGFAARNVLINAGAPLVVAAQTQADLTRDIGFGLEEGQMAYQQQMNQAAITKWEGKMKKKQSYWNAAATGVQGLGSIAYMGNQAGWFSKTGGSTFSAASTGSGGYGGTMGGGPTGGGSRSMIG